jgi:hypothetical protein
MVINHIHGGGRVEQCLVAGFVKSSPGDEVDCCPDGSQDERCTESGCAVGDFALIFDQWEVAFTAAAEMDEEDEELGASILDIVSLAILELEHEAKRPVQVRVEWNDTGAHALLVTGVDGTQVHVIDPLEGDRYGGWHEYSFLRDGFGQGNWTQTWPGLMKK